MSVLIKGMEMPTYCNVCPMQRTDNTGEITFCALTRKVTRWWMYDRNESSEGNCPLIEIKPHGRLIDADALIGLLGIMGDKCDNPVVWEQMRYIVEDVPTIIPSDKESGE